jgi:hypothetical protein
MLTIDPWKTKNGGQLISPETWEFAYPKVGLWKLPPG